MAANASSNSKSNFLHKFSDKQILIIVSFVMIVLLLDTTIIRISDLTLKRTSGWQLVLFSIIAAIALSGQNLILRFVNKKVNKSTTKHQSVSLNSLYKVALILHYLSAAIVVFSVFQMLIMSRYDVVLLNTAISISYAFAVVIMAILCYRFIAWFRLNKNYVILLYGLSAFMLALNACITLWLVNSILLLKPEVVMPHVMVQTPQFYANVMLNTAYTTTTIASFIVTWLATLGLLKNYVQRMAKITYWIALILPLAYFVSQFLVLSLGLLSPLLISSPVFYGMLFTIIFTLSKPIGGVIFAIGFWLIARNIHKDNVVRRYLIISAYGFLLLFTANQAIVLTFTYYPPFGLATISFVGLSSFLVLLGIYSSAISISQDANLRRDIRRLAIRESKLLDIIGLAQIEGEIKKQVIHIAKINKNNIEESGIPTALDEGEVNRYVEDVLNEIKAIKKKGFHTDETADMK